MKKPKIVEATGSASAGAGGLGQRVQTAMAEAIEQAYAEGLADDPEAVRHRMQVARDQAKAS